MSEDGPDRQRISEAELIVRYFAPLAQGTPEALGLSDDAALLRPEPGCDYVCTTDGLVAGQHFFADDPARDIAFKALAVNISDLIAKGAAPAHYFLTLALPRAEPDWLAAFAAGLAEAQAAFGCGLAGGDTVRTSGPVTLSITAIGAVPAGTMITRAGAKLGDCVYLSGSVGDAALGLAVLRVPDSAKAWRLNDDQKAHLVSRYRRPEPRYSLLPALREYANAALDVSDGLVGDFATLCQRSGLGGEICAGQLPLSEAASGALEADSGLLSAIVTGGDDYEILAAIAPEHAVKFEQAAARAGVSVTRIGAMTAADEGIRLSDAERRPIALSQTKFDHFGGGDRG